MKLEKPLPNDNTLEQVVLGSILIGHKKKAEILEAIKPDDFFDQRHERLAKLMISLRDAGKPIDTVGLYTELEKEKQLEGVGGVAYISSLTDGLALRGGNVLEALKTIKRKSQYRKFAHMANKFAELAMQEALPPETLLEDHQEHLSELIREAQDEEGGSVTYKQAATSAVNMARLGCRLNVRTGITALDLKTGGFREGELVVLTAETGTGKSLLAAQIRTVTCNHGQHALFCSGEMTAEHLASRELASVTDIGPHKMRQEWLLTPKDLEILDKATVHQCEKCRILAGDLSITRIRREARRLKNNFGLDLLILDYDELIDAEGKTEFDQQRVIARAAKGMAMELKCVVILISQLRKSHQGEDTSRPTLQRLYGSGAKQKYANFIILADRPFVRELQGDEKEAKIQLLKSRDSSTGRIKAVFNVKTLRFEQSPEEAINWRGDGPVQIQ